MNHFVKFSATDEFDSVSKTGNLTAVEWTPENGWKNGSRSKTYPRPAAGPGSHMGLTVILEAGLEDYYCSSGNSAGFKVRLHVLEFGMFSSFCSFPTKMLIL